MHTRGLDSSIFLNERLTLYRLTRSRYADLSGLGAAKYRGRWNQTGQEAIYTSCEASCTVLELLAHTPKNVIPSNLALMTLRLTGNWVALDKGSLFDTATLGRFVVRATLADAYQYYNSPAFLEERPFALAVPSVIAPTWNVVLYPASTGFWAHISFDAVDNYKFDPRLFPDEALPESLR